MADKAGSIKITNAALQETPQGSIILRGVVDPGCLHLLQVAPYQREVLPLGKINDLVEAFKTGSVPDIELGMRGQRYTTRATDHFLQDDVFIIDGLQRVSAALHYMKLDASAHKPQIGAAINFSTTEDWERERFRILNAERTKLSPNILIRNLKDDSHAVNMLYNLCKDKSFVLGDRVCWSQRMSRQELLTALSLAKVVGRLHAFAGPGRSHRLNELTDGLDKIMEKIGRNTMRDNTKTLFDIVDQSWGVRRVAYKEGAAYLRTTFLSCLANIFAGHYDFWRGKDNHSLFVERDLVRKIAQFPVTDPHIVNLSSAGGKAGDLLYQMMLEHINSGKRTRRLKSRGLSLEPVSTSMPANDEEQEVAS